MQKIKKTIKEKIKDAERVAILGIGSQLMGDDRAGILIAQNLKKWLKETGGVKNIRIFFGYTAPENLSGKIKTFKPSHLLIIDSAYFEKPSGAISVFEPSQLAGISFSTHRLPIDIFSNYLYQTIKCKTIILGIQPGTIKFSDNISSSVSKSIENLTEILIEILKK